MRALTTAAFVLMCLTTMVEVNADESADYNWCVVEDAFPTAEYRCDTRVKISGDGSLRLIYDGDGRSAMRTISGPTDGWQPVSLHLRANPERDAEGREPRNLFLQTVAEPAEPDCDIAVDDCTITPLYQHHPPKLATPPIIDGDLSDACWNDASYVGNPYWRMYNKPADAKAATHVWCAYDDEHLYVAFRCMTPRPRDLVEKITERDGPAWRDDSAEIFLDPRHDHWRYYEYVINPKEVVYDSKWFREGGVWQKEWNYFGKWKCAVQRDSWTAEIALDLRSYEERDLQGNPTGYMPLPTGDVAGILFSRNDRVLHQGMSWADCIGSFHATENYGHLVGFKPNYVSGYRKFALRAIDELDTRWSSMYVFAGRPKLVPSIDGDDGTEGVAEALAALRSRAEADRPDFDEWVAIGQQIKRMNHWLNRAETVLAADICRADPRMDKCGVAVASPFDSTREFSRGNLPETLRVADVVEVFAARGEYEPVCLYLLAPGDEPVTVPMPSALTSGDHVLPVSVLCYEVSHDHLMPVSEVTVEPGRPKQIWCLLEVPRAMAPGEYDCDLRGDPQFWLPQVKLTVREFALPLTPSLPVAASFRNAHVNEDGEDIFATSRDKYWRVADQLLRHRIAPAEMLADFTRWQGDRPDFTLADQTLARAETFGVNPNALMLASEAQLAHMTDPVRKLGIAQRHWRRRLGQNLVPVFAFERTWDGGGLPPRLLERSLITVDEAWGVRPEMLPFGTWAVNPGTATGMILTGEPQQFEVRQAAHEDEVRLAWDGSRGIGRARPIDWRMAGWLAWKNKLPLLVFPETQGRVASSLLYAGHGDDGPVYDPPFPTMKLEMLRDGLEDYEYLKLLSDLQHRLRAAHAYTDNQRLYNETSELLEHSSGLIENAVSYTDDPEILMRWRERVATQIERSRAALRVHGQEGIPGD